MMTKDQKLTAMLHELQHMRQSINNIEGVFSEPTKPEAETPKWDRNFTMEEIYKDISLNPMIASELEKLRAQNRVDIETIKNLQSKLREEISQHQRTVRDLHAAHLELGRFNGLKTELKELVRTY